MNKVTVSIPDRSFSNSMEGNLPRRQVSLSAPPPSLASFLDEIGVHDRRETKPVGPPIRREKVEKPQAKGEYYPDGDVSF